MAVRKSNRASVIRATTRLAPPKDPIIGKWAGQTQYRCPDCNWDTLREGDMVTHLKMNHRVPLDESQEVIQPESAEPDETKNGEGEDPEGGEGQDPAPEDEKDPAPSSRQSQTKRRT